MATVTQGCTSVNPNWYGDFCWTLDSDRTLGVSYIGGGSKNYHITQKSYDEIMDAYDETEMVRTIINRIRQQQEDKLENEIRNHQ